MGIGKLFPLLQLKGQRGNKVIREPWELVPRGRNHPVGTLVMKRHCHCQKKGIEPEKYRYLPLLLSFSPERVSPLGKPNQKTTLREHRWYRALELSPSEAQSCSVKVGEWLWRVKGTSSSWSLSVVATSLNYSNTKPLRVLEQIFKISSIEIQFICHKLHPLKEYNSVVFSIFTQLCNHPQNLILEHVEFHHILLSLPKIPYPISSPSLSPFFPQPLATTIYFVSIDLFILDVSYKWNLTIYGLHVWLLLFSVIPVSFIHVVVCVHFYCWIIFHCI